MIQILHHIHAADLHRYDLGFGTVTALCGIELPVKPIGEFREYELCDDCEYQYKCLSSRGRVGWAATTPHTPLKKTDTDVEDASLDQGSEDERASLLYKLTAAVLQFPKIAEQHVGEGDFETARLYINAYSEYLEVLERISEMSIDILEGLHES